MIILENNGVSVPLLNGSLIIGAIVYLAITLIFYVLRSIGIFCLARNRKIDCAFLAFIPFAWMYLVFQLIGDSHIFGLNYRKYALLFTIVIAVAGILDLLYTFLTYYPYAHFFLEGGKIILRSTSEGTFVIADMYNHFNTPVIAIIKSICLYAGNILSLVISILEIFAFIALFKKYSPSNYILYSLLSIITGLFPVFVFVIRNAKAVSFTEYVRSRYYNPYGPNPNGDNQSSYKPPEDPFEDLNGKNNKKDDDLFS